jgi:subtilisin
MMYTLLSRRPDRPVLQNEHCLLEMTAMARTVHEQNQGDGSGRSFAQRAMAGTLALGLLGSIWMLWGATAAHADDRGPAGRPQMVDVLIGFKNTPGPQEEQLVRGVGGRVRDRFWLVPTIAATVPEPALRALQNDRRVQIIEPDGVFELFSDAAYASELKNTWGVERIGTGVVHKSASGQGIGIGVAVLDSGLDTNHPEFAANYAGGYNFHDKNSNVFDDDGHGTHVAGTVAAARDGFGVVGVAPEISLYALRTLGRNGGSFSSVIAALEWCVKHNAAVAAGDKVGALIRVTNNSYGSSQNPGLQVQAAFDNSYAAGILHIAAAGNSGSPSGNNNTVGFPAAYASVVAVAATNQNDTRPSWSSTGPAVEISAPGVGINSTLPGSTYGAYSGTSMASPHVAGAAALILSQYALHGYQELPGPAAMRDLLALTAVPLGKPNHYGAGLVDVAAAVALVIAGAPNSGEETPPEDETTPGDDPMTKTLKVDSIRYSNSGKHLDITLQVVDAASVTSPVSGALARAAVYRNGSLLRTFEGTTGADGTVTFRVTNARNGTYSTEILAVELQGWDWDGQTPANSFVR